MKNLKNKKKRFVTSNGYIRFLVNFFNKKSMGCGGSKTSKIAASETIENNNNIIKKSSENTKIESNNQINNDNEIKNKENSGNANDNNNKTNKSEDNQEKSTPQVDQKRKLNLIKPDALKYYFFNFKIVN